MTVSLASAITWKYPHAIETGACVVQDNSDGKGPFIAYWDAGSIGAPKPDAAALQTEATVAKLSLKAAAAAHRYDLETGGYTLSGQRIETDRETQDRITQANVLANNDPTLTQVRWKKSDGTFVMMPVADLHAIGIAVGRFVQACYDAEGIISGLIDAGTIATEAAIASWSGWPAAES